MDTSRNANFAFSFGPKLGTISNNSTTTSNNVFRHSLSQNYGNANKSTLKIPESELQDFSFLSEMQKIISTSSSSSNDNDEDDNVDPRQTDDWKHMEINTRAISSFVNSELKLYGVPQIVFAKHIICRSQGTLSDLLRNPKPWCKMKLGRDTFRKMYRWSKQPEECRIKALKIAMKKREQEKSIPLLPDASKTPKKPRRFFTEAQRRILSMHFQENKRPSKEHLMNLAQYLELDFSTVANYFMNARRRSYEKWIPITPVSINTTDNKLAVTASSTATFSVGLPVGGDVSDFSSSMPILVSQSSRTVHSTLEENPTIRTEVDMVGYSKISSSSSSSSTRSSAPYHSIHFSHHTQSSDDIQSQYNHQVADFSFFDESDVQDDQHLNLFSNLDSVPIISGNAGSECCHRFSETDLFDSGCDFDNVVGDPFAGTSSYFPNNSDDPAPL